jgi:hypothetical protein
LSVIIMKNNKTNIQVKPQIASPMSELSDQNKNQFDRIRNMRPKSPTRSSI